MCQIDIVVKLYTLIILEIARGKGSPSAWIDPNAFHIKRGQDKTPPK